MNIRTETAANAQSRFLGLDGNVAMLAWPIQHGLQRICSFETAAKPHGIPAGELRKPFPLDKGQQVPGVFVYGVGIHKRIGGFGVRQKVPADEYGMLHGLPVNGIEHGILGVFHDVQNPTDTQCPPG